MRYINLVLLLSFLMGADDNAPAHRTRDRQVDIQHIKIDVAVDIENESVYGHVVHTLSPLHSSLESFSIDASDMTIRRVRADNKDIRFNHNGDELLIILDIVCVTCSISSG